MVDIDALKVRVSMGIARVLEPVPKMLQHLKPHDDQRFIEQALMLRRL